MKRRFDQIDKSQHVHFQEQAYAFEHIDLDMFKLSLAVIDPLPLLPFPEKINSAQGWLENIDEICKIGKAEPDFCRMRGNDFSKDFAKGMRKRFKDLYLDEEMNRIRKPDYVVYNTVVDFYLDRPLNDSVFDFSVDLDQEIDMGSATFKNYGPRLFSLDKNFRAAQQFELSGRNDYDFNKKYTLMSERLEGIGVADTTGQFVVWGAGIAIKKAAALHADPALNLILSRDYMGAIETRKYSLVKEQRDQYNNPSCAPVTKPLGSPEDLFNIVETIVAAKDNKQDLLDTKQARVLVSELQKRSDASEAQTAPVSEVVPVAEEVLMTKEELLKKEKNAPTKSFGNILQMALDKKYALAG